MTAILCSSYFWFTHSEESHSVVNAVQSTFKSPVRTECCIKVRLLLLMLLLLLLPLLLPVHSLFGDYSLIRICASFFSESASDVLDKVGLYLIYFTWWLSISSHRPSFKPPYLHARSRGHPYYLCLITCQYCYKTHHVAQSYAVSFHNDNSPWWISTCGFFSRLNFCLWRWCLFFCASFWYSDVV